MRKYKEEKHITCRDCISGETVELTFAEENVVSITRTESSDENLLYIGPGLIDLQINGVNGIDFNNPSVNEEDVIEATHFLLRQGVTCFFPTVITNSDENICKILSTISRACTSDALVNSCIRGIHLEGPFLSAEPGAKGAHNEKYIKPPDWPLFQTYQKAAGGRIKIITLAPEWEGAFAFIEKCRSEKIVISIGHSMANTAQIQQAIKAGASMCTHLGNAVPLVLPRHPNILWDLLAAEELHACVIADGIHVPDNFMRVVKKNKGSAMLLVSDATCFAGMPPGEYQNHIGGTVIVDKEKRVSMKSTPGLLAGAAMTLPENVTTLVDRKVATIGEAWEMASVNVANFLVSVDDTFYAGDDFVLFQLNGNNIQVTTVIKDGKIVF
ncbi:MAG TPA: hypothetical protein VGN63_07365 [Flavisolibacter sp.]|jgi:N-acetylglucosamine-6-phosphate deacetylase|nr:hypothetical protein [Flavisolibacter sp.]